MVQSDAEPIPISSLGRWHYCARHAALVLVDGIWVPNENTARGDLGHRVVDRAGTRDTSTSTSVKGMSVWSESLGLTGRCDVVEFAGDEVSPVEFKMGSRHGIMADVQLCAQALCLEEMFGCCVDVGHVWYASSRRRHRVEFNGALRRLTFETVRAVHEIARSRFLPPAPNDKRCRNCQVRDHCMPALVAEPAKARAVVREVFSCES